MTYDALEISDYSGHAVELFEFRGSFSTYFLTSYATDYVYNFRTYNSIAGLKRGRIKKTSAGGSTRGDLEIQLPFDHPLAFEYAFSDVPPNLDVVVLRGHVGDADEEFRTIWTGAATSWSVEKRKAKLLVPSSFTLALANTIPSKRWQGLCNNLLYDANCGVNRALHDQTSTVSTFVGNQVQLNALTWSGTEGVNGEAIITRTGERRTIQSHSGTTIELKVPFSSIFTGDEIIVYEGCDLLASTCLTKFNNLDNFFGFNLVPSINPFTQSQLR